MQGTREEDDVVSEDLVEQDAKVSVAELRLAHFPGNHYCTASDWEEE